MRERSERLKEHIHGLSDAGVRRSVFYALAAESLRHTEGEPRPIRRAQALAHLLDRVDLVIFPHELIVGSVLGLWPVVDGLASYERRSQEGRQAVHDWLVRRPKRVEQQAIARWALMSRNYTDGSLPYGDLQQMAREIADQLGGQAPHSEVFHVLERHFVFDHGEAKRCVEALPWFASNHLHLNYAKAVRRGLGDIAREVAERRAAATDAETREFYASVLIAVEAASRFIRRYQRALLDEAERGATGAARAVELRKMAAVCAVAAEGAPQSFREALQLVWLLHTIGNLAGGSALSFARFDQYLFPFYQRDLAAGRLTRDEARELIACFWLKANEPQIRTVQSLCLGGVDCDGRDATNELTYLCLEVLAEVREPYPNTALRVHGGSPEALWDTLADALLVGTGQPMVYNDDVQVPALERLGYPAEDAREYFPMGCVETMLGGMQPTYQGAGIVMLPGQLELVFRNGEPNTAGERGLPTGELSSFHTFEDLFQAYLAQVAHRVEGLLQAAEERHKANRELHCDPFASALVDDCLEKGLDICRGGARYPVSFTLNAMGIGTAADALSAIKTFVFDRKLLTLEELRDALDRDFAGCETLRQQLAQGTPTFGNDLESVDSIAARIHNAFCDAVRAFPSSIGALHAPQMFSYHSHVWRGEITGATPDGRHARTAFSDGIGPSQGRDVRGPTCLLNSVTRLDHVRLAGGCGFNLKLAPNLVAGPEGRQTLKALLRAYFQRGGIQIQVNLVGRETLRAAQAHPEQHRHIIVRVAGFCEYFVNLDRKLQDEIIARTAHQPDVPM